MKEIPWKDDDDVVRFTEGGKYAAVHVRTGQQMKSVSLETE